MEHATWVVLGQLIFSLAGLGLLAWVAMDWLEATDGDGAEDEEHF